MQAQILETLLRIRDETNAAMIMITHDLGVVAGMVDRVQVMYGGTVVEAGAVDEVFDGPAHAVHGGPARLDPEPGHGRQAADPDQGRAALAGEPADGLRILAALPAGASRVPRVGAGARWTPTRGGPHARCHRWTDLRARGAAEAVRPAGDRQVENRRR